MKSGERGGLYSAQLMLKEKIDGDGKVSLLITHTNPKISVETQRSTWTHSCGLLWLYISANDEHCLVPFL